MHGIHEIGCVATINIHIVIDLYILSLCGVMDNPPETIHIIEALPVIMVDR